MKLSFAALLGVAASAFGFLAQHDSTGTLGNPSATLEQKAAALEPAVANAGAAMIEEGLTNKLGPEGAVIGEMAVPLLQQAVQYAQQKIAAFTGEGQADPEAAPQGA